MWSSFKLFTHLGDLYENETEGPYVPPPPGSQVNVAVFQGWL